MLSGNIAKQRLFDKSFVHESRDFNYRKPQDERIVKKDYLNKSGRISGYPEDT